MHDTEPTPGLSQQLQSLDNPFWLVNGLRFFERMTYWGLRSVIPLYMVLPVSEGGVGFDHIQKGTIFAAWAAMQGFPSVFTGGLADRYGHRKIIALSLGLKILGFTLMGLLTSYEGFFAATMMLAAGTALFKPTIPAAIATQTSPSNASVAWGVFYLLSNIGAFLAPIVTGVLRNLDWGYVFWVSAALMAVNLVWLPFYPDPNVELRRNQAPALEQIKAGVRLLLRPPVALFMVAISGFWLVYSQLFDLLPNFIDDWVDSSDVLAATGSLLSLGPVPLLLSGVLGIAAGSALGGVVLVATRPDRQPINRVSRPATALVGLALGTALYLPMASLGGIAEILGTWLLLVGLLFGLKLAFLVRLLGLSAKVLAGVTAGIGALGAALLFHGMLAEAGATISQLAVEGGQVNPEWLINLNPALIILTMVGVAWLGGKVKPLVGILLGVVAATLGAVIAGHATVGAICLVGIGVFTLGEMLTSPRKLEYLASLSPKGQEGVMMGFANIPGVFAAMLGSLLAGYTYETDGDKVNLARRFLVDHQGWTQEAAQELPRAEVLPILSEELGYSALEVQQMLWELYAPQQVWVLIGGIGLASVLAMGAYTLWMRRREHADSA